MPRRRVEIRVWQVREPRLDIGIGPGDRLEHTARHVPKRVHIVGDGLGRAIFGIFYPDEDQALGRGHAQWGLAVNPADS